MNNVEPDSAADKVGPILLDDENQVACLMARLPPDVGARSGICLDTHRGSRNSRYVTRITQD